MADFQKAAAPFDANSYQLAGDPRSIFVGSDITRYQLRKPMPANKKVVMPAEVRKLLKWSRREAETTVGAYPAK